MLSAFRFNLKSAGFIYGKSGGVGNLTLLNKFYFFAYYKGMTAVIVNKASIISGSNIHQLTAHLTYQCTSADGSIKTACLLHIFRKINGAYVNTDTDYNTVHRSRFKVGNCLGEYSAYFFALKENIVDPFDFRPFIR